jgi:tRNA(Ile)-lysidine synthase
VIAAQTDANPLVHWSGVEIRRYQQKLYALTPLPPHDPGIIIPWNGQETLQLPQGLVRLNPALLKTHGIEKGDEGQLTIRFRQGGEKIKMPGQNKHRSLKKVLQQRGIPPWQRSRIPLLYVNEVCRALLL